MQSDLLSLPLKLGADHRNDWPLSSPACVTLLYCCLESMQHLCKGPSILPSWRGDYLSSFASKLLVLSIFFISPMEKAHRSTPDMKMAAASQLIPEPSRLLQCPPEVRDMIWIYAVRMRNEFTSNCGPYGAFDPTEKSDSVRLYPSYSLHPLRATCRIINAEASPHVFNLKLFKLEYDSVSYKHFLAWLDKIGTDNRLSIHYFCPSIAMKDYKRKYARREHARRCPPPSDAIISREVDRWCRILQLLPHLRHLSFPR